VKALSVGGQVKLVLTSSTSSGTATANVSIGSGGTPQFTADFTYAEAPSITGTTLTFTPTTSPANVGKSFSWDFGDTHHTNTSTYDPVSDRYLTPASSTGPWVVTLVVTDASGNQVTVSKTISIGTARGRAARR